MIGSRIINSAFKINSVQSFAFSTITKKKQMELTLRTPYSTIYIIFRDSVG